MGSCGSRRARRAVGVRGPIPRFVVPSAFLPRNRWVTFSGWWYGMIRCAFSDRRRPKRRAPRGELVELAGEHADRPRRRRRSRS
jgi:hypothetical protein